MWPSRQGVTVHEVHTHTVLAQHRWCPAMVVALRMAFHGGGVLALLLRVLRGSLGQPYTTARGMAFKGCTCKDGNLWKVLPCPWLALEGNVEAGVSLVKGPICCTYPEGRWFDRPSRLESWVYETQHHSPYGLDLCAVSERTLTLAATAGHVSTPERERKLSTKGGSGAFAGACVMHRNESASRHAQARMARPGQAGPLQCGRSTALRTAFCTDLWAHALHTTPPAQTSSDARSAA